MDGHDDYERAWADISTGLMQLLTLTQPFPHAYWVDIYTKVFKVCSSASDPRPQQLYEDISALLIRHCQGTLRDLQQLAGADMPAAFLTYSEAYFKGTDYIAAITQYLNRWWISKRCQPNCTPSSVGAGVFPVPLLAARIMFDELFAPAQEMLFDAMMQRIKHTRDQRAKQGGSERGVTSFGQLRTLMAALRQLDAQLHSPPSNVQRVRGRCAYVLFEESFLRHSVDYYTREGRVLQTGYSCTEFMLAVHKLLQQEKEDATQWLPSESLACLSQCCLIALVYAHREFLCSCIPQLLQEDCRDDLRRLYQLIKPAQGLPAFTRALQRHVEECGAELRSIRDPLEAS
jgi:hypothetical protein